MENQVKTVVCPNCGASAHNLRNCEFCGSFLVQRAAEGKDLKDYVAKAASYPIDGLIKVIKQYSEILQSESQLTEVWLDFTDNTLPHIAPSRGRKENGEMVGEEGIEIVIEDSPDYNASLQEQVRLFKNSEAFPVFAKEIVPFTTYDRQGNVVGGGEAASYTAEFGYDYEGAARVVYQLLESSHVNISEITPRIYSSDNDYILFNSRGEIIEREGDGDTLFHGVGEVEEKYLKNKKQQQAAAEEQAEKNKTKGWILTAVCLVGGILMVALDEDSTVWGIILIILGILIPIVGLDRLNALFGQKE